MKNGTLMRERYIEREGFFGGLARLLSQTVLFKANTAASLCLNERKEKAAE